MEEVIEQLKTRCDKFAFWHKVYAVDLFIPVNNAYLEALLTNLHEVSKEFDLKINPQKCAILIVRRHNKIDT
jgi:uncharacterized protein YlaN (UPF0358 family)